MMRGVGRAMGARHCSFREMDRPARFAVADERCTARLDAVPLLGGLNRSRAPPPPLPRARRLARSTEAFVYATSTWVVLPPMPEVEMTCRIRIGCLNH